MPLSLNTRAVGDVTIVRCIGRIVAGGETESLREHITGLRQDRSAFVLHLGEVAFIDSSGLGTLVRLLTSTRRGRGDLKLCNVPQAVDKVLPNEMILDVGPDFAEVTLDALPGAASRDRHLLVVVAG